MQCDRLLAEDAAQQCEGSKQAHRAGDTGEISYQGESTHGPPCGSIPCERRIARTRWMLDASKNREDAKAWKVGPRTGKPMNQAHVLRVSIVDPGARVSSPGEYVQRTH